MTQLPKLIGFLDFVSCADLPAGGAAAGSPLASANKQQLWKLISEFPLLELINGALIWILKR